MLCYVLRQGQRMMHPFSLIQFITQPLKSLSFLCLILTYFSLWTYKRFWIWIPLLSLGCICAYFGNILDIGFLIPVSVLFIGCFILTKSMDHYLRILVVFVMTLLIFAFNFHLFPDIHNWLLASPLQISKDAPSFNYYWNFDKAFPAIFLLALNIQLLRHPAEIRPNLIKALTFGISAIIVLIGASFFIQAVHWDIKFPLITPIWLIGNLFFVVIPEETFYRGFLQRELTQWLPGKLAPIIANLTISIIFALAHLFFMKSASYAILAFVASFAYGFIYEITGKTLESAIALHYTLNVVHFIFFTYPISTSAL